MNSLAVPIDPPAIAAAIIASGELGLAGSSAMTSFCRVTLARELVLRINAAKAKILALTNAIGAAGRELTEAEDAQWTAAEAEETGCRDRLKEVISERLGVCADDLWTVL